MYEQKQPSDFVAHSGDTLDFLLNEHYQPNKRTTHVDMRMGTPSSGLYSWALPKGRLPEEKEKLLAVQTPVHDYQKNISFSGELPRGKGTVRPIERGKTKILKVSPDKITFEIMYGDAPAVFTLIRNSKDKDKWILRRSHTSSKNDKPKQPSG
jgi:hypothetical protein